MTDREMLEFAAKVAGITVSFDRTRRDWAWNSLDDDGDALRLAVKLGLVVCVLHSINLTGVYLPAERIGGKYDITEHHNGDPLAATRRAIARAAAEIGRNME